MRLEINAGGIDSFFNGVYSFVGSRMDAANCNNLISNLQNIVNKTNNLSGGAGTLSLGLDYVQTRKTAEESRKIAIENVKTRADSFIQTALRIDASVAASVSGSQDAFYKTNSWLRPPAPPSNWDRFWGGVGDTISKCWKGIKEFCSSNTGKIILGVVAVVGAIALVAMIISTGGLALVPLLAACGLSAGLATGISLTVAGIAIASTAVAFIPNCLDLAAVVDEVVDPEHNAISDFNKGLHQKGWYNTTQSVANITGAVTGGLYSIGNIYNAAKGVTGKEFLARQRAIENGKAGYGNVSSEHPGIKVEAGRDYSRVQKDSIYKENMRRNGGVLRDDVSGKKLIRYQSQKGVPKPLDGSEIDHIVAQSNGGFNSYENARIVNWETNLAKSNSVNFPLDLSVGGVPDIGSLKQAFGLGIGEVTRQSDLIGLGLR